MNAKNWNDHTGGVMSSAACGSSGVREQDYFVFATGSTAQWDYPECEDWRKKRLYGSYPKHTVLDM